MRLERDASTPRLIPTSPQILTPQTASSLTPRLPRDLFSRICYWFFINPVNKDYQNPVYTIQPVVNPVVQLL